MKWLGKEHFETHLYVNFEENPKYKTVFETDLDPTRIVEELQILLGTNLQVGKGLLIFDEVQECSQALTSLKYFNEKMPELHLIASDSLLGLKAPKSTSFPVGKIEILNIFPLSIAEFFEATGHETLFKKLCSNTKKWLVDAKLVIRCDLTEALRLPFSAYASSAAFKLFSLDVGLLGAFSGLDQKTLLEPNHGVFSEFKGALTENLVAQELCSRGISAHSWSSEGKAEVDFVFSEKGKLFAAEVKAGVNLRSQSMGVLKSVQSDASLIYISLLP